MLIAQWSGIGRLPSLVRKARDVSYEIPNRLVPGRHERSFRGPCECSRRPERPGRAPPEGPPQDSGWRIEVGGGVLAYPRFPGPKDTRVLPIPAIEVHYGNRFFASVREGVG